MKTYFKIDKSFPVFARTEIYSREPNISKNIQPHSLFQIESQEVIDNNQRKILK